MGSGRALDSATPHEVTLVEATLAHRLVQKTPGRLIGDNAYESDQLDAELAQRGIALIVPHRRNRTRRTDDGRPLRRYRRRWKMEFPGHVAPCLLVDLAAGVYEMTSSLRNRG